MSTNKYEPQWIKTNDEKGQLASIGISWFERRPRLAKLMVTISMMCVLVFVFALIGAMVKWPGAGDWLIFGALGGSAAFWGAVHYWAPNVPRAVIFERGGRIRIPHGIPLVENLIVMRWTHSDIASIETRLVREFGEPEDDHFSVRLVGNQGNTVVVSRNLEEDEALMVAVRLNNALTVIREAAMVEAVQSMFSDGEEREVAVS